LHSCIPGNAHDVITRINFGKDMLRGLHRGEGLSYFSVFRRLAWSHLQHCRITVCWFQRCHYRMSRV